MLGYENAWTALLQLERPARKLIVRDGSATLVRSASS